MEYSEISQYYFDLFCKKIGNSLSYNLDNPTKGKKNIKSLYLKSSQNLHNKLLEEKSRHLPTTFEDIEFFKCNFRLNKIDFIFEWKHLKAIVIDLYAVESVSVQFVEFCIGQRSNERLLQIKNLLDLLLCKGNKNELADTLAEAISLDDEEKALFERIKVKFLYKGEYLNILKKEYNFRSNKESILHKMQQSADALEKMVYALPDSEQNISAENKFKKLLKEWGTSEYIEIERLLGIINTFHEQYHLSKSLLVWSIDFLKKNFSQEERLPKILKLKAPLCRFVEAI